MTFPLITRSLWASGKKKNRHFIVIKGHFHPTNFNIKNCFKKINNKVNRMNTINTIVYRNCLKVKITIITKLLYSLILFFFLITLINPFCLCRGQGKKFLYPHKVHEKSTVRDRLKMNNGIQIY